MKKHIITIICFICISFIVSGCVSMEAIQHGLDDLEDDWGRTNNDIYKTIGSKTYKITKRDAFTAMNFAMTSIGITIINQDFESGFIYAEASQPAPLTKEEWEAIRKIEEPKMQTLMAVHVGEPTSQMIKLSPNHFKTLINILMLERHDEMIEINIKAQSVYIGPQNIPVAYGKQPPPEALRYALRKAWDGFERELFVLQEAKLK